MVLAHCAVQIWISPECRFLEFCMSRAGPTDPCFNKPKRCWSTCLSIRIWEILLYSFCTRRFAQDLVSLRGSLMSLELKREIYLQGESLVNTRSTHDTTQTFICRLHVTLALGTAKRFMFYMHVFYMPSPLWTWSLNSHIMSIEPVSPPL